MKEFEKSGQENIRQSDIINRMVQIIMLEENSVGASVEESIEQSKKIANVINHLIQKENVLMIAQDAKIKNERYLCLNVNLDLQNMNLGE